MPAGPLSRAVILDAALAVADRDGLAGLSMRRLGAELGVEAMSLYHHVAGREAVLDGLVERVVTAAAPPTGPPSRWRRGLRDYAHALRTTLRAHPAAAALLLSRPATTPALLRLVEAGVGMLVAAGFRLTDAMHALNALTVFVAGHVAAEVAIGESGVGATAVAELDPEQFPLLVRAARDGRASRDSARFEWAVEALLTGFAARRRPG